MAARQTYSLDVDDDPRPHDPDNEDHGTFKEVVVTILAALVLAYLVQGYLVKPFRIPSGSMENTLHCGDRVLVNRLGMHFGVPERGDVIVFHPPADVDERGNPDPETVASGGGPNVPREKDGTRTFTKADVNYIKRVIGEPGDTVEVRKHRAYVNGKQLEEPYLHPLPKGDLVTSQSEYGPIKVPKGTYFMMGDHRQNSADSREFGVVPRDFVIGGAFMVYWPPKRIGALPDRDPGGPEASQPDENCIESVPNQGPDAGVDG